MMSDSSPPDPDAGPASEVPAALLREAGHRATLVRLQVWRVLCRVPDRHLTARAVWEEVRADLPRSNLASVYRALTLWERMGLACETRLPECGPAAWEPAHRSRHQHLVCRRCHTIRHAEVGLPARLADHLRRRHGFASETIQLLAAGTCVTCRNAER
jgi:Fur family ferric uptake transcriptional regulator